MSLAFPGTDRAADALPRRHAPLHGAGMFTVRVGGASTRTSIRAVAVCVALGVILAVGAAWSISVGDFPIPIHDVVATLFGYDANADYQFVILTLRWPRVLTGMLVGAAFGMSGQIFQRLVRNPLASPDIMGISTGAALAAVGAIVLFGAGIVGVTFAALVGAMATVALMYVLAYRRGISSYRLVLVGIGLTALFQAGVNYLMTRADIYDAQRALQWITGSLSGRGWEYVRPLSVTLAVLGPLALIGVRSLRALELGDAAACGLGVGLGRAKLGLSFAGAVLAAVATAAAGPVGFVALVSPQIARRLTGDRVTGLVPAALVGAVIVTYADIAARRLFAPTELPVGVFTAVIGAPFLLWLLARANQIGAGG